MLGEWIAQATRQLWSALPEPFILDWVSTVQTRYGHLVDAEVGYNLHKPGRRSHHRLLAVVGGTRLSPYFRRRSGKSGSCTQWVESMEECEAWIGQLPWLNRGDKGLALERILACLHLTAPQLTEINPNAPPTDAQIVQI